MELLMWILLGLTGFFAYCGAVAWLIKFKQDFGDL
tara:strand:+ start:590 stop:694 length:105 start_codon:yes stop_codon:yes gene_type:complete